MGWLQELRVCRPESSPSLWKLNDQLLGSPFVTADPLSPRRVKASFHRSVSQEAAGSGVLPLRSLHKWLSALPAALPMFVLSYSSCVSYAQLIVTNSPVRATAVVAMHLLSCGLTGVLLPLRSRCPLIVPSADITITIFYQRVVQDIVAAAAATGDLLPHEVGATALLALPINTLLVSLLFWVVGREKATVVVSYLPYPVVAGFLATIGWAIFAGSFEVLAGDSVSIPMDLPRLAREQPAQLACTVAVGVGALVLRSCRLPPRTIAVVPMAVALAAFWIGRLAVDPVSEGSFRAAWLFPTQEAEPFWKVWTSEDPTDVRWMLLAPRVSTFLSLGLVLLMSLTLRIAGIEGSVGVAIDVDEEVRRTGIVNLVAGLCGGVIGSHSPGLTTFNLQAGSEDVHASLLTAILTVLIWLSGIPVMDSLPRFMLAGILMNLGLMMMKEWMWAAGSKVGKWGLFIIYAQVGSSLRFGLLPSILLGITTACVVSKVRLVSLNVLKYHMSGKSLRSHVRRTRSETATLDCMFSRIEAMGLEGTLAEGPMLKFSNYVRKYIERKSTRVKYLILDFRSCQGTNSSACALLAKLDKFLCDKDITTLYANLESEMASGLDSFLVAGAQNHSFETLPDALEYCENLVLASARKAKPCGGEVPPKPSQEELLAALAELVSCSQELAQHLAACGTWNVLNPGTVLATQGRRGAALHFCLPRYSKVCEEADCGQSLAPPLKISLDGLGVISGIEGVLFDECSRSTCTVAGMQSHVLSVRKDALQQLIVEDMAVGLELKQCIEHVAALQFLRRGDRLSQAVHVARGGGWRGAHFDIQTSQVAASLLEESKGIATPTIPRRKRETTAKYWQVSWQGQQQKSSASVQARHWLKRRELAAKIGDDVLSPVLDFGRGTSV